MLGRSRLAVLAVSIAVLAMTAACSSSIALTSWAGKNVLAVAQLDGKPFLVAEGADGTAPQPGQELTKLGVKDAASVRILRSGSTRVLAWNSANGPMRFAVLDAAKGVIEQTKYTANAGVFALKGEVIYSARQQGSGSVVESYSLARKAVVNRITLPFFPDALVSDGTSVVALGGAEAGSQGVVIGDGSSTAGTIFRLSVKGAIAGAAITKGWLVVAVDRATPATGSPIGRPALMSATLGSDLVEKGRVAKPQLVEALGDGRLAIGDSVDGRSVIRIVDPATGATNRTIRLESQTPLLDLVSSGSHQVTAIQSDGWTVIDASTAAVQSLTPPGELVSSR